MPLNSCFWRVYLSCWWICSLCSSRAFFLKFLCSSFYLSASCFFFHSSSALLCLSSSSCSFLTCSRSTSDFLGDIIFSFIGDSSGYGFFGVAFLKRWVCANLFFFIISYSFSFLVGWGGTGEGGLTSWQMSTGTYWTTSRGDSAFWDGVLGLGVISLIDSSGGGSSCSSDKERG